MLLNPIAEDLLTIEQRHLQNLRMAGVPPRFLHCRMENYQPDGDINQEQFAKVQTYFQQIVSGVPTNFVMAGQVGTGKTHLACALIHEFLERQGRVWFISFAEYMRLIRQGRGKPWEDTLSDTRLLERAKSVRVLILDDIGVNWGTDWDRQTLDEIVNHRYENLNSTIITTNLSIAGLFELMGERAFDRMVPQPDRFLTFVGRSHRRNG